MDRAPGLSVRMKLTLSYAGFLMVAGALLLYAVALCAKESVIALPGVIFLYEASRWRFRQSSLRGSIAGVAAYGLVMVAYFQARYLLLGAYVGGYGTASSPVPSVATASSTEKTTR